MYLWNSLHCFEEGNIKSQYSCSFMHLGTAIFYMSQEDICFSSRRNAEAHFFLIRNSLTQNVTELSTVHIRAFYGPTFFSPRSLQCFGKLK